MPIVWLFGFMSSAALLTGLFFWGYLKLTREFRRQTDKNLQFLQGTHQNYQSSLGGIENRLGHLQQATTQILELGKEIASLQNILQNPKLRGGMGEFLLEELLAQILPAQSYSLQHSFADGQRVDAVIHLQGGMVTLDSKFPLENYQKLYQAESETEKKAFRRQLIQDVKKHLNDIAEKYIRPGEGTLDFSIAFIPAESVYYEAFLSSGDDARLLSAYALTKKILAVSPQGLYAYLQVIARGLKGLRIERTAQKILEHLNQFEGDFSNTFSDFEKIGTHLKFSQTAYDRSQRQWISLRESLTALSLLKEDQNQNGAGSKREAIEEGASPL